MARLVKREHVCDGTTLSTLAPRDRAESPNPAVAARRAVWRLDARFRGRAAQAALIRNRGRGVRPATETVAMTGHACGLRAMSSMALVVLACVGLAGCGGGGGPDLGQQDPPVVIPPVLVEQDPPLQEQQDPPQGPQDPPVVIPPVLVEQDPPQGEQGPPVLLQQPPQGQQQEDPPILESQQEDPPILESQQEDPPILESQQEDPPILESQQQDPPVLESQQQDPPVLLQQEEEQQGGPDLVIETLRATNFGPRVPVALNTYGFFLKGRVRNTGDRASPKTWLRYYRSTDATITPSDTQLIASDPVEALAASAISSEQSKNIKNGGPGHGPYLAPGTYYFGACVRPVPGETDTTNNCSTAVRWTLLQSGPAPISVADAEVDESGEYLKFYVTMGWPVIVPFLVDYETVDGTAKAGEDYTAVSGTFEFRTSSSDHVFNRALFTTALIHVPVIEDSIDEGPETLTLRLSNLRVVATGDVLPARLEDATATGTITNSDPIPQAWNGRFGRTVGTHVVDAVGTRLRDAPEQDSHVTVGGYRLPLGPQEWGGDGEVSADEPGPALLAGLAAGLGLRGAAADPAGPGTFGGSGGPPGWAGSGGASRLGQRPPLNVGESVNLRQILQGTSFRLHLGAAAGGTASPRLTAWGRFAGTRFAGQEDTLALDGDVFTGTVGVDGQWDRLLAGVAVAHSRGDGTFTNARPDMADRGQGELENTLTSLHPYLRYAVTDALDIWGLLGYGWGELDLEVATGETRETTTNLVMGAFGARGIVLEAAESGGVQLATRTDAMLTRTSTDAVTGLAAAEADAHRLRVILEGSQAVTWADGRRFTPTIELGLRHDWGDAETGFGVEVGGRVQYADPRLGLTIEGTVRGLLAHEDRDYDEWGASGTLRLAPGAGVHGLALSLSPTWGAAASGVDGLWDRQTATGLVRQQGPPGGQLNAEVGYGLPAPVGIGLLTPYAGTMLTDGAASMYRVGTRLRMVTGLDATGLTLGLEGTRQEAVGAQPVNQGLRLQMGWGF